MINDIMIGQYFPGTSILHKIDARVKMLFLVVAIVAIFLCNSVVNYIVLSTFVTLLLFISHIPMRLYMKASRPMLILIFFTFLIHICTGTGKVLWQFWFLNITKEGIVDGFLVGLRLFLLVQLTSLLTFTTPPLELTTALERILEPFKKIGIPTHEFAMIMTIALRFIPTLLTETDKIIKAQKSRGADFTTGSIGKRLGYIMPILVPLFVSAFRRADELAIAMEARCYHGDSGRTRLREMHLAQRDYGSLALLVFLTALFVIGNNILPLPPLM